MNHLLLPTITTFSFLLFNPFSGTTHTNTPPKAATTQQPQGTAQTDLVRWYTWEQAAELQKKEKRKVFVDVYTGWCGWCKRMDATTFNNPAVAKILNQNYYAVKLDAEQKADILFQDHVFKYQKTGNAGYNELATSLLDNKMSFPTVVFLDEDYKMIQTLPGYQETDFFKKVARYFGENFYKNIKWEDYQKTNG